MSDTPAIPVDVQIACLKREIALRKNVYPKWVASGRMKQDAADREIGAMTAALHTLLRLQIPDIQSKVHNETAGKIVRAIVQPILETGGQFTDVLVLTESVLVGVALVSVKLGGDNKMLDLMLERARMRLAEIRLTGAGMAGTA